MNKNNSNNTTDRCKKDYAVDRLTCGVSTAGDHIGAIKCQLRAYDKYDKCRNDSASTSSTRSSSFNRGWGREPR